MMKWSHEQTNQLNVINWGALHILHNIIIMYIALLNSMEFILASSLPINQSLPTYITHYKPLHTVNNDKSFHGET